MKKYTINFDEVKTYYDFYNAIIQGLNFPSWCGQNPDAIWDLLTGYFDAPAEITVTGIEKLPSNLIPEWEINKNSFEEAEEWFKKHNETIIFIYK